MSYLTLNRLHIIILVYIFIFVPEIWSRSSALEKHYVRGGLHAPCFFFHTVNVTDDQRFDNGSYLHDGILIPHKYIAVYNHIYTDLVTTVKVTPHLRGCICKVKPCINFCCPFGKLYSSNDSSCIDAHDHFEWPTTLNMTLSDGSLKTVNVFKQYAIVHFRPCNPMYALEPQKEPDDAWQIFANGTIFRHYDESYLDKLQYCMVPTMGNDTNSTFYLNPANCDLSPGYGTMKIINAYAMLFSIPFMMLTILVYLAIPELRNQHGKSLVCYLFGLIVGYTMLCLNAWSAYIDVMGLPCKVIGYTAYYFFMAAFFWLSVISFDLWHNFRGTRGINRFQEKKRFAMYSVYSWGIPIIFLIGTWFMQERVDIPYAWKPGIGGGEYCWINMLTWSGLVYFFAPIMGIIVANIIMFIMTAMKIHKVQREMARIMAREDSTRNLRNEKDKFGLFLRLFLVMGVTWSLEIVSYFVGVDKPWSKIFYVADICNAIQGFLIFMLFVMKKKVKQLITNRYSVRDSSNQRQSHSSTKTTCSSVGSIALPNSKISADKPLIKPLESTTVLSGL
ncbi:G-protein coupled receptor Mth2-like isoform X2 [Lucilia sericata]|uniref:G-protein coupled receptor Mth2-like isoform X2 n=1 Tax=Lucilia sericata TaxID=13632 RepID=UPI0018A873BC|nr:G-protein coupled receptor Mth2-like isoform X2 [Lucilia sericata]